MSDWPVPDVPGFERRWREACAGDAVLAGFLDHPGAGATFAAAAGPGPTVFAVGAAAPPSPAFTLRATPAVWDEYLKPLPKRHHHNLFALRMRVPGFAVEGDELAFVQSCHIARRVMEIGRHVRNRGAGPVPTSDRPALSADPEADIAGRYVTVALDGVRHRIYVEQAGSGRDLLCLHTAGADGRQFHRLMADRRVSSRVRLTSFDLPWHGKSPPPAGAAPGDWRLTTERYVAAIMGVIAAAGLRRPLVLGASMSGEICLELALRHPEAFTAIVACEASAHIEGRRAPWSAHPAVNQALFVPEWVYGLIAPGSPAPCAADIWWHYSQGGYATFNRDIQFYSGGWDARDRVGRIDTRRCPLFMLTGEYDYSCTAEHSEATAAEIAGARFQCMDGIGHFPFAENPALFAEHLWPILDEVAPTGS